VDNRLGSGREGDEVKVGVEQNELDPDTFCVTSVCVHSLSLPAENHGLAHFNMDAVRRSGFEGSNRYIRRSERFRLGANAL
jgi:hypothetical protein